MPSIARPDDDSLPRVLPRGRHALSRDVVRASQRERLLEAMVDVVAEKGYHAVTIGDIVQRAGTARRSFYEHFDDKVDAFLAGFSRVAEGVLGTIMERFDPALDQAGRAAVVIGGFLEFLASKPAFAYIYFVEVNAVGPAGIARALEVRRGIATMIVALRREVRDTEPHTPPLTEQQALAVVGALHEITHQALHERGAERLTELRDELVPLAVALLEVGARSSVKAAVTAPEGPCVPRIRFGIENWFYGASASAMNFTPIAI